MSENDTPIRIEGSIFKFLSSLFKKQGVRGVLVGGYALIANKVQRTTFDIDFLMTASDCGKIEPDLAKAGYSVFNRQDAFVQFKSTVTGLRDIDFLIGDEHTIEKIITNGKTAVIAGEPFFIPSALHLIEMKLHSIAGNRRRELKDFPDIVQLFAANGIDPQGKPVKELFEKYRLQDLYQRLLNISGTKHGR
jgi:hypothetical protein